MNILKKLILMISPILVLGEVMPADSATVMDHAPEVFIDCWSCDMAYIKTEVDFVNYVIDRNEAEIFIMITRQSTGSNGREYTLTLEGRDDFAGVNDTLIYVTEQNLSEDEVRSKTVHFLKLGLVRYLSHTDLAEDVEIQFKRSEKVIQPEDRWNNWVFRSSLNGWFNGQASYGNTNLRGRLEARRVTEDLKIRMTLRGSYDRDWYLIDEEKYVTITSNPGFNALVVKSMSDHLSLGFRTGIWASTYGNYDMNLWFNPAIEYNVFPYKESSRREFRFRYLMGFTFADYIETTIYDQDEERLLRQALDVEFEIRQPWGSAEVSVSGSHYFHDLEKNRLDFRGELSLKIWKGFSYDVHGGYSLIHDQLALPKGEATSEEILLNQQELETQYSYWGSMGVSYTFGSIYNNIVNPRF